jgi:predicted NAD/FAD-dependent oxidoreductase
MNGDGSGVRTVAVVGAGLAGLMAARALRDAGHRVTVFDKGRRPGGRVNTREHGPYRFDHGAQFFTARSDTIRNLVSGWIDQGVVKEWSGRLVRMEGASRKPVAETRRYVGVPDMIAVAAHLAEPLDIRSGVRIEAVRGESEAWTLTTDSGRSYGPFSHVVVAVPAPQAVKLLNVAPALRSRVQLVDMTPCWATMFAFEERLPMDFDGAFISDGPLSWIVRDSSKPHRPDGETWVTHGSPEWSNAHRDVDAEEIPSLVYAELTERFGPLPEPSFQRAHRWGYAVAAEPESGTLYDADLGIGVCGDWCVGRRVESALVSGMDIARRMIAA